MTLLAWPTPRVYCAGEAAFHAAEPLSWLRAVQIALKVMPRTPTENIGNPVLDDLSALPDMSSPLGRHKAEPLIEALEDSPRSMGVRRPEDLAELANPGSDEEPAQRSAREKKLTKVMKGAANRARGLINHRAESLADQFREGVSAQRLDFVREAMETLIFFQGPYLNDRNKAMLSKMRGELAEARRRRLTGLIRHEGDALAEKGLPGRLPMPERLDIERVIAYSMEPRPFPLLPRPYIADNPPRIMDGAQFRVLSRYQAAINCAVARLKAESNVKVDALGGELAQGRWDNAGISSPKDGLRAAFAPLKLYVLRSFVDGYLTSYPKSQWANYARGLRKEIHEKFGVFLELETEASGGKEVPIDEIRGSGLFRHIAVKRWIQTMKTRLLVWGENFDASLLGLGFERGQEWFHRLRGSWVLSVGAGIRPFAKILEQRYGIRAVAMDWWYALTEREIGRELSLHKNQEGAPLPAEIALRDLPSRVLAGLLPEPSFHGSPFEEVVIHDLMEDLLYVNEPWAFAMLEDAFRITKPGGRVRFRAAANQLAHVRAELHFRYPAHRLEFPSSRIPRGGMYQGVVLHKPGP